MQNDNLQNAEALLLGRFRAEPLDTGAYEEVKRRWDGAAKPLDSLGAFEEVTARIGAIAKSPDIDVRKKTVIVFCADNGIVKAGVSQSTQEVTLAVSRAMGKGESSVCKMAAAVGAEVVPIDIGIASDETPDGLLRKKVRKGTRCFLEEPAMTFEEARQVVRVGMDAAEAAAKSGSRLIALGEMGIGNTTTAAAIVCALTKRAAFETVGRGAGLSEDGLKKKAAAIDTAIEKYGLYEAKAADVLCCVGGFDVAGMVGTIAGAALNRVPVVLDGAVSCAAALLAQRLSPKLGGYVLASHAGKEPVVRAVANEMGLRPVIDADMALGEGTGAVMMFALLDVALTLYDRPLTFEDIEIEKYERFT